MVTRLASAVEIVAVSCVSGEHDWERRTGIALFIQAVEVD